MSLQLTVMTLCWLQSFESPVCLLPSPMASWRLYSYTQTPLGSLLRGRPSRTFRLANLPAKASLCVLGYFLSRQPCSSLRIQFRFTHHRLSNQRTVGIFQLTLYQRRLLMQIFHLLIPALRAIDFSAFACLTLAASFCLRFPAALVVAPLSPLPGAFSLSFADGETPITSCYLLGAKVCVSSRNDFFTREYIYPIRYLPLPPGRLGLNPFTDKFDLRV